MLTEKQIEENKQKVIFLVNQLDPQFCDIDSLLNFLDSSDFYVAPFTSKYTGSYKGGLCEYSLKVYLIFEDLTKKYLPNTESSSVILLGLFCNLWKTNYYEIYTRNQKNEQGQRTQVQEYRVTESNNRYVCGSNGLNSFMLISRFCSLTESEIVTLVNYNCGMDDGYKNQDLPAILKKYPLVDLLHSANLIACYVKSD